MLMHAPPEPEPDVDALAELARGPSAVVLLADVPGLLGLDADSAALLVAQWADEGVIELWPDFHAGPALALSSLAASRLGLELADGPGESVRWVAAGSQRPERPRGRARVKEKVESDVWGPDNTTGGLDGLPDPAAVDPADAVRDDPTPAEVERERTLRRWNAGPSPMILLGLGHAWPVAPVGGRCGVCFGRMLGRWEVCLWCNSVGLDPRARASAAAVAATPSAYVPDALLMGGMGTTPTPKRPGAAKASRKAARKAKAKAGRPKSDPRPARNSFDLDAFRRVS